MTPDPIRAALERLHEYAVAHPNHDTDEIVAAARAALDAAPEGDGPINWPAYFLRVAGEQASEIEKLLEQSPPGRIEASPATPPTPAAGEAGELVEWLHAKGREGLESGLKFAQANGRQLTRAAALLEQLSAAQAPQPVALSERLPGPEDCLPWPGEPGSEAELWCWTGSDNDGTWEWAQRTACALAEVSASDPDEDTHWLPAHALPIPAPTPAGQEGE